MSNIAEVIGVDIGAGTAKMARIGKNGSLKSKIEVVKTVEDPKIFMQDLANAVKKLLNENVKAVGLGIPSWDGEKEIIQHSPNMPTYEGLAVGRLLESSLSGIKVFADNDANVAADGERVFGKWDEGTLIAFTLGSGIGGGVILYIREIDRYIKWQGDTFKGAELGHVSIPVPSGRQSRICGCGHIDCMEAHASATAIRDEGTRLVLSALAHGKRSLILDKIKEDDDIKDKLLSGEPQELVRYIEPLHVNLAASDGDEIAMILEEQTAQALAYGIRNVAQIFDPKTIVLAGAMRRWDRMVKRAEQIYNGLLGVVPAVKIGVSELENAGIVGSAALALGSLEN